MIKKTTFLLAFFIGVINVYSQCVKSVSGFGFNSNVPSYNVSGDVFISYNNNQITFKTAANYSTASGPDVRVYLVNSEGRTNQQLIETDINNMINIPFGLVSFSGEQELTIAVPNGVDLKDYDTVFFYCFDFGVFWDFGKITPIDVAECSELSFSGFIKTNNIKILENPITNFISLDGDISKVKEYKIYNIAGLLVLNSVVTNRKIDVSKLSTGIYSLVLISDNSFEFKKIIKI